MSSYPLATRTISHTHVFTLGYAYRIGESPVGLSSSSGGRGWESFGEDVAREVAHVHRKPVAGEWPPPKASELRNHRRRLPFGRDLRPVAILCESSRKHRLCIELYLPARAREILVIVREQDHPSTGDIIRSAGLCRPVVSRTLQALAQEGLIERIGTSPNDPRAYWRLRGEH